MNSSASNAWSQLLRKEVGSLLERPVREAMAAIGLASDCHLDVGILFQDVAQNRPVLADLSICQRADLEYIDGLFWPIEYGILCGSRRKAIRVRFAQGRHHLVTSSCSSEPATAWPWDATSRKEESKNVG